MLEKDLSPNVLRRLDRIKRKTNETDDSVVSNALDLVMHDTEYQIKAVGEILKKYKISKFDQRVAVANFITSLL
jgi:predicted transcriptional regulator